MLFRLLRTAAPLLVLLPTSLAAQAPSVTVEAMRRHIDVLASDAYEGRKPGTAGENKTLLYITSQMRAIGLEPAAGAGAWYQPVPLVERRPVGHRVTFSAGGAPSAFDQADIALVGREPSEALADAPIMFVGHGTPDQTEGTDFRGSVALILFSGRDGMAPFAERSKALAAAGAEAVIAVMSDEVPWSAVQSGYAEGQTKLQASDHVRISGAISMAAAQAIGDGRAKVTPEIGPGFRAVWLDSRASFEVSTDVRRYNSHNVIGRLRGSGGGGESILYLGHWDHLGICRPDAADKICNGAVDNASGIAMLIEIARNLARGRKPVRDILFMATTAEEVGLLGARHFGANPTVPPQSLIAAVNIDTVAIAGRGEPVAIVGRGTTPLDPLVDATARELGRRLDTDEEANAFIQRQDGWELTKAGIPTVMVGGSFSNMERLGAFLSGPYHKANDDLSRPIVLDGAAEDAELMIALGRKLADPARYRPPGR